MSNYATMRGRFPNLPETNAESPMSFVCMHA
jgi:hypothetical protein